MTEHCATTIGERLKKERLRLGYNQDAFASIAKTTKRSQYEYEKGAISPNTSYLASIAGAGADVHYIITGVRSALALAPEEELLLERYRGCPHVLRSAALRVLSDGAECT